jgi:hypothetical protein
MQPPKRRGERVLREWTSFSEKEQNTSTPVYHLVLMGDLRRDGEPFNFRQLNFVTARNARTVILSENVDGLRCEPVDYTTRDPSVDRRQFPHQPYTHQRPKNIWATSTRLHLHNGAIKNLSVTMRFSSPVLTAALAGISSFALIGQTKGKFCVRIILFERCRLRKHQVYRTICSSMAFLTLASLFYFRVPPSKQPSPRALPLCEVVRLCRLNSSRDPLLMERPAHALHARVSTL